MSNPFPEDFGFLRIGTPINVDQNRPLIDNIAFDMAVLEHENLLAWDVNTTSEKHIEGRGLDTKSQEAFSWSAAASLGFKFGFIEACADFHYDSSANVCKSSTSGSLEARATQNGAVRLQTATVDQLLKCATPLFLQTLNAVRAAKPGDELVNALKEFKRLYGTGFIHRLDLRSTAMFKGTFTTTSDFAENKQKYGGGFSVKSLAFSGSAAAEFCKQNTASSVATHFEADTFGVPADCGPATWVEGFLNSFAGAQAEKLNNASAWQTAFDAPVAKAAKPEFTPKPAEQPKMEPTRTDTIDAALKEMQLREWVDYYKKQHGGADPPDSEAGFIAQLEKLREQAHLTDVQINDQAMTDIDLPDLRSITAPTPEPSTSPQISGGSDGFGGFGIVGYGYKRWDEAFPELKPLEVPRTVTQVAHGQSLAWLSMRTVFAQYLNYCAVYPEVAGPNVALAANEFNLALSDVRKYLADTLRNGSYDMAILPTLEAKLKERLTVRRFQMYNHYTFWIANYAWLKQVPFGAVAVVERTGRYYYQKNPWPKSPTGDMGKARSVDIEQFDPAKLVADGAYRLYPIISTDPHGKPFFVWLAVGPINTYQNTLTFSALVNAGSEVEGFLEMAQDPKYRYYGDYWNSRAAWGMHFYVAQPHAQNELDQVQDIAMRNSDGVRGVPSPRNGDEFGDIWRFQTTAKDQKALAFYYPAHDAWLLWGAPSLVEYSAAEIGSPEVHEILLVPITYSVVENAGNAVPSGGMPMWMQPRTDQIIASLNQLAHD